MIEEVKVKGREDEEMSEGREVNVCIGHLLWSILKTFNCPHPVFTPPLSPLAAVVAFRDCT